LAWHHHFGLPFSGDTLQEIVEENDQESLFPSLSHEGISGKASSMFMIFDPCEAFEILHFQ